MRASCSGTMTSARVVRSHIRVPALIIFVRARYAPPCFTASPFAVATHGIVDPNCAPREGCFDWFAGDDRRDAGALHTDRCAST